MTFQPFSYDTTYKYSPGHSNFHHTYLEKLKVDEKNQYTPQRPLIKFSLHKKYLFVLNLTSATSAVSHYLYKITAKDILQSKSDRLKERKEEKSAAKEKADYIRNKYIEPLQLFSC